MERIIENCFSKFSDIQKNTEIQVSSVIGQLIETRTIRDVRQVELELEYPAGLYLIKVVGEDGKEAVFKVLKE